MKAMLMEARQRNLVHRRAPSGVRAAPRRAEGRTA
jgi:hypothetical protein